MGLQESAITAETISGGEFGKIKAPALKWLEEQRGLSLETLAQLNVASGTTFFPDVGAKRPAIFFQYAEGWKARAFPEKAFVSGGGFKRSFWNLERVLQA